MAREIFDEIRRLVAEGAIEPALVKTGNVVQSVREDLGRDVAAVAILLAQRYSRYQLERLKGTRRAEDLDRQLNLLVDNLLGYVALLEQQWADLPEPARGPAPQPADQPSAIAPRDPREALLSVNPLRRVSWLQKGVESARAVCRIRTPKSVGTGFLVHGGRLITNNHVLPSRELAEQSIAIFNFEEDFDGKPAAPVSVSLAPKTFKTNPDEAIDCTVVGTRCSGGPVGLGRAGA